MIMALSVQRSSAGMCSLKAFGDCEKRRQFDIGKPTEEELVKNVVENRVELQLAEFGSV